jgi:hypothetical protein
LIVVVAIVVGTLGMALVGTAAAKDYKVGTTAPSGDLLFTVYGFTDPWTSPNQFDTPKPGNHYVVVDVGVKNPKKSGQQTFSSLLLLHLLDKSNKQYSEALIGGAEPPAPNGVIPAKQEVRGLVGFEVPDGAPTPLRFRAQGNITAGGAYWKLKQPPPPPQ